MGRRLPPGESGGNVRKRLFVVIAASALAACSSPPLARTPSGGERVPVNSPTALKKYETDSLEGNRDALERAALEERIRELQGEVTGLRSYVILKTAADEINAPKGTEQGSDKPDRDTKRKVTHPRKPVAATPIASTPQPARTAEVAGVAMAAVADTMPARRAALAKSTALPKTVVAETKPAVAPAVPASGPAAHVKPGRAKADVRAPGSVAEASKPVAAAGATIKSRPPAPPPPKPLFLMGGSSLERQLDGWAKQSGWTLVWNLQQDWIVPAGARFEGGFVVAAKEVIESLAKNGVDVRADVYSTNRTLVVHPAGAAQ